MHAQSGEYDILIDILNPRCTCESRLIEDRLRHVEIRMGRYRPKGEKCTVGNLGNPNFSKSKIDYPTFTAQALNISSILLSRDIKS